MGAHRRLSDLLDHVLVHIRSSYSGVDRSVVVRIICVRTGIPYAVRLRPAVMSRAILHGVQE